MMKTIYLLVALFTSSLCHAQMSKPAFHSGWVMARAIEYDAQGKSHWVAYGNDGKVMPGLDIADGDRTTPSTFFTMGAAEYNTLLDVYVQYRTQHAILAQGAELLTAEAYENRKKSNAFKTVTNQAVKNVPELKKSTNSVLVRANKQLYTPESELVLFESPLDLTLLNPAESNKAAADIKSILLDQHGKVLAKSSGTIGLQVAWFDGEKYGADDNVPAGSRPTNLPIMGIKDIYGPVEGVPVFADAWGGGAVTRSGKPANKGEQGYFSLSYMVPCGIGSPTYYNTDLFVKMPYKKFNPSGTVDVGYKYARGAVADGCTAPSPYSPSGGLTGLMAQIDANVGILLQTQSIQQTAIYVDVMYVSGLIYMKNADGSAVKLGGETAYATIAPTKPTEIKPKDFDFDFDGDGHRDIAFLGTVDAQQQFHTNNAGDKIGIYLSSDPNGVPAKDAAGNVIPGQYQPHFVRLLDKTAEQKSDGYTNLTSISKQDLKDTDIYLYRTSNGHLIKHQARLTDSIFKNAKNEEVLVDKGNIVFGYVLDYMGPQTWLPAHNWLEKQSKSDERDGSRTSYEDEALKGKRESDHLRIGESLTVVVINRKTGYMGTTTAKVDAPSIGGDLSFKIEPITLRPPNLKIIATRKYTVEAGSNKDEEKDYTIGMEGAALKSDTYVEIDSLWLDQDGRMLPEDLGQQDKGYTARLAKVSGSQLIADSAGGSNSGSAGHFTIQPGYHKQVLKLQGGDIGTEHYYVHVSGGVQKPGSDDWRKAAFNTLGSGGLWSTRPKFAVPFLVNMSSEKQNLADQLAYNQAKTGDSSLQKPDTTYGWEYRPEFQFSVWDFKAKTITQCTRKNPTDAMPSDCREDDETLQLIHVYDKTKDIDAAIVNPYTDLLKVLFDFQQPAEQRLAGFGAEQQIILSLGGTEHVLNQSQEGLSEFYTNLKSLAQIGAEDFLSMRLYLNSDPGNVLWEYAFGVGLQVAYALPEPVKYIAMDETAKKSGDDPKMQAYRTLGGARLKLEYAHSSSETLDSWSWNIPATGATVGCFDNFKTVDSGGQLLTAKACDASADQDPEPNRIRLYWQPDWGNAPVESTLTLNTSKNGVSKTEVIPVRFARRELAPQSGTPMEGSDVAMLEQMLWNIGISPSGSPGIGGKRLSAEKQSLYESGTPSVSRMVGRFNYISYGPVGNENTKMNMKDEGNDMKPVEELGRHWNHYLRANDFWKKGTVLYSDLETPSLKPSSIDSAVAVWDGVVSYPDGISFSNIDATYSQTTHDNVKNLTGENFESSDILKAMAQMEVSGIQQKDFRTRVGGADERASKGFNQILNTYNYGASAQDGTNKEKAALEVTGYRPDGSTAVNHYDARYNIIAKAVWLAIDDTRTSGGGGGSFYRAFAVFKATEIAKSYLGTYTSPANTQLKNIVTGTVSGTVTNGIHQDDNYERLAKGLGGYNQGAGNFQGGNNKAWINILISRNIPKDIAFLAAKGKKYKDRTNDEKKLFANTEAVRYAISIMHDSDKLGLPYRSYFWQVGIGATAFCFEYGEEQWVNGTKTWAQVRDDAIDDESLHKACPVAN